MAEDTKPLTDEEVRFALFRITEHWDEFDISEAQAQLSDNEVTKLMRAVRKVRREFSRDRGEVVAMPKDWPIA